MYDQPQQPVNSPVAYSVPVVQTSNPIPEDQREEEHPLSFMDNIQRYSDSNYTKVRPKAFKKKKVYSTDKTPIAQEQPTREQGTQKSQARVSQVNIQKSTVSSPRKPRFIAGVPNYEPIPEEYNPLYGPKRAVQEIYKFLNSLIN